VASQVVLEDGTKSAVTDHLREDHRKGTRGMNEEYLAGLHATLHEPGREPEPGHAHPGRDGRRDQKG
jgi:hypothetical protein